MPDYPSFLSETNQVEPVPRRIRAVLAGETVVDTTEARYVWEWPGFPQYYIPLADIRADTLLDENTTEETSGATSTLRLRVGDVHRPNAAKVLGAAKVEGLDDTVRFEWSAFDAWYEEDEQVFVHPRNPYIRVDTLRSTRHRPRRVTRRRPGRIFFPGALLRDGAPDPLLLQPHRRRLHQARADRHRDVVPLQGNDHRLLVRAARRSHASRRRLDIRLPDPEVLPIAGLIRVLQRETRPLHRWRPARAARDRLVRQALNATFPRRARTWSTIRRAEPPLRISLSLPFAEQSATAQR